MGGSCGTYGVEAKWIQVLLGKPWRRRPLGRPKHGWDVNMKDLLNEWGMRAWTSFISQRMTTSGLL